MQKGKEQTATGFLAAILIGGIIGSLGAYPINQWANKTRSDAISSATERMEILEVETKAWIIAETATVKEAEGLEDIVLPLLKRLRDESQRDPRKKLLFENTQLQLGEPLKIVAGYRLEVLQITLEGMKARSMKEEAK